MSGSSSMRGGRTRKFKADINVVPYIDVMMVLLVIFMVSAPLTNPSVINLPNAAKSATPPTEYIEITLKPGDLTSIRINGQKSGTSKAESVSRNGLKQKLQLLHADKPDMPVMISADKDIKYDEVIKVISEAKMLGINRVGLATK
ncbi:biopolymer transporter ExbD [Collimonas sp. OK412]|jgi:biopolymer transport protein TolR|uniref:biopolymer transporter ExbD n=1 Tax=Collimonas sp. (strain OK412) TaxID=1801619 RepID=UPI0008E01A65|nr:biopolymer transporter ExbD [Collimonas sp. OK412]SFD06192.1 Cell division and transport-associated protein TolR (TC 2.C.1.2.1) [Collimonas sp. OK412]